jgi:hypothetical protein
MGEAKGGDFASRAQIWRMAHRYNPKTDQLAAFFSSSVIKKKTRRRMSPGSKSPE